MAETLGARIQSLRQAAELTQEQLAARSGLPVTSLRNWEQDHRAPGVMALYRLAKALGLPMERFVEGVEEAEAPGPAEAPKGKRRKKT